MIFFLLVLFLLSLLVHLKIPDPHLHAVFIQMNLRNKDKNVNLYFHRYLLYTCNIRKLLIYLYFTLKNKTYIKNKHTYVGALGLISASEKRIVQIKVNNSLSLFF